MENVTDKKLSFPQRNWFLLCVMVAILSPMVVYWIQNGARKVSHEQTLDIQSKDSSYKVASPPGPADTSQKNKTADSAAH